MSYILSLIPLQGRNKCVNNQLVLEEMLQDLLIVIGTIPGLSTGKQCESIPLTKGIPLKYPQLENILF